MRPHVPSKLPRIDHMLSRVLELSKTDAERLLKETMVLFADRHKNIEIQFMRHFDSVSEYIEKGE